MNVLTELKHAARSLARSPAFTALAVLTLGVGMGAATAAYTVLRQVVFDPLDYPEVDRLLVLRSGVPGVGPEVEWGLSSAQLFHLAGNAKSLSVLGAYATGTQNVLAGDGFHRVIVTEATAGVLPLVGARARLGRLLEEADDDPGSPLVTVLSHGYWQRRLGADPDIVGKTIRFDPGIIGQPLPEAIILQRLTFEVVGVLEPGTSIPGTTTSGGAGLERPEIWIPYVLDPAGPFFNDHGLNVLASLASGHTVREARAELELLTGQLEEAYPQVYDRDFVQRFGFQTRAYSVKDAVLGDVALRLWLLQGAVALLLLIAWANAVNLMLARVEMNRAQLAVRTSLGAMRRHVVRYLAVQSLLIAAGGAVTGCFAAWFITRWLVGAAPPLPRLDEVAMDGGVLSFVVVLSLVAALALAVLAGWPAGRAAHLAGAGRGATGGRRRQKTRTAMLVAQVTLSLTLVFAAGLVLTSFRALSNVDPGINADSVITASVYPNSGHVDGPTWWRVVQEMREDLGALPGVSDVGASSALPLTGRLVGCVAQEFEDPAARERLGASDLNSCAVFALATPGWFDAMGVPVLRGRAFEESDLDDPAVGAVVVSRAFAERFYPGEDPLGKRIAAYGAPWHTIVGVVGDVFGASVNGDPALVVYYPLAPIPGARWGNYDLKVAIRTELTQPSALVPEIVTTVGAVDPEIIVEDVEAMTAVVQHSMSGTRFALALLAGMAAGALILAMVGLYGVVVYLAAQRTREVGVRMALGAKRWQVRRMMVAEMSRPVAGGLVIGCLASLAAEAALRSRLFGIDSTAPLVLVLAALALILAAGLATWVAAGRAAGVSPVEALRVE